MQTSYWQRGSWWQIPLLLFLFSAASQGQTGLSIHSNTMESAEERLEAALARHGSMEFVESPLRDVISELARQFSVPMHLAVKPLEDAGVNPDTPVTAKLSDLPLDSLLRLLLTDLELGYTIRHNVIVITTLEDLESNLDTRIYPVLDLVTQRRPDLKQPKLAEVDYEPLVELVTTTIAPDTWDEVGGPGTVDVLDNAGAMVVSQTRDVHRDVEKLLATLRRVKVEQGIPSIPMRTIKSTRVSPGSVSGPLRRYSPAPAESWQIPQVYDEK